MRTVSLYVPSATVCADRRAFQGELAVAAPMVWSAAVIDVPPFESFPVGETKY